MRESEQPLSRSLSRPPPWRGSEAPRESAATAALLLLSASAPSSRKLLLLLLLLLLPPLLLWYIHTRALARLSVSPLSPSLSLSLSLFSRTRAFARSTLWRSHGQLLLLPRGREREETRSERAMGQRLRCWRAAASSLVVPLLSSGRRLSRDSFNIAAAAAVEIEGIFQPISWSVHLALGVYVWPS